MMRRVIFCGLIVLGLVACGDEGVPPSADTHTPAPDVTLTPDVTPTPDVPPTPDVSPDDVAAQDTPAPGDALSPPDGGAAAEVETAWGTITGACGVATAAVSEPDAALLRTTYTFKSTAFDPAELTGKPRQRYEAPNAGGSSKCSEVMSMQLLIDCEGAEVTKTETEVVYDTAGKMADYLVSLGGVSVGVSVTRAYKGPVVDTYTLDDARDLLTSKLEGLAEAATLVSAEDAWDRNIVHIWTLHPAWAETVASAWDALEPSVKGDALVLVTVEVGSDVIVTDSCDE